MEKSIKINVGVTADINKKDNGRDEVLWWDMSCYSVS
jgi:hypothetical protein